MDLAENIGGALGTLIGLSIFVIPPYVLAKIWNKLAPKRRVNPWSPALVVTVVLLLIILFDPDPGEIGASNKWMLVTGFLAPLGFCFSRYRRWRREIAEKPSVPEL